MVILKFLNSKCLPAQRNEKENRTNEIISVDSFILSHIHVHVYVCVSELVTVQRIYCQIITLRTADINKLIIVIKLFIAICKKMTLTVLLINS